MGQPQNERRPVCLLVTVGFRPCCGHRNWRLDRIIMFATWGRGPCATPRAVGPLSTLSIDFGIGCAARNTNGRFGVRRFAACGDVDRQLWAALNRSDDSRSFRSPRIESTILPADRTGWHYALSPTGV